MAAQSTYTLINSYTGASNISDISFSNIPQNYTDLLIVVYGASTYSASNLQVSVYLNGDYSSSLHSYTYLRANGSAVASSRGTNSNQMYLGIIPAASSTGIFGTAILNILNYSNTTTYKTMLSSSAADLNGSGSVDISVSMYQSTSPVTTVNVATYGSGNWTTGSRISLYGIQAA